MNNAIITATAGMPSAAAVRMRPVHFWGIAGAEHTAAAYEAAGNLRFAAAHPASDQARAHRNAVPVRHRQLS